MAYVPKIPVEAPDYKICSDFIIGQISAIMADALSVGNNKIFIHTNLKRGLPLENINKIAGPFVEAWAMEQFENIADIFDNAYKLIYAEAGRRLDAHDIILQFRRADKQAGYVSAYVDVKATAEDILSSGKSPNITSYARIRSEYINDPDYIFIVLSLKHRVFSEKQKDTGMTNGIMEVVSYSVYDLKFISEADLSYNPSLGTGQLQIRDIHYVQLVARTTWDFCQMLDAKFMRSRSRGEEGWLLMAKKYGWVKEI
ncbi:MAG: hypothetical protein ACRYFS_23185 [Janthinobacterium lividum]